METVDCVIVGAGVIGLAIARALAMTGHEVLVLERNERHGMETSSRNSEVIHAGIHYPLGSLKARLCVRGRALLYDYCALRGIGHRRCGKLIVATAAGQQEALRAIEAAGRDNGVDDLRWLDGDEAHQLEPALSCTAALLSPSTGIIDVHAYMLALLGDVENHDARLVTRTRVDGLRVTPAGIQVRCGGDHRPALQARWLINAGGLRAGAVAASIAGFPTQQLPQVHYAKGSYFSLSGRSPFDRLIYPLPEPGGLGVHLTLDLSGQARFGPDIEWVHALDYAVDPAKRAIFASRIRAFWPDLAEERLTPAYAGLRPKLSGPGEPAADFRIDGPAEHGIPGIINLFGIESPGLTSSLAIAEVVAAQVGQG